MSDHIDTRNGWVQVTVEDIIDRPNREYLKRVSSDGGERYWVRQELLPTGAYTVIRVDWEHGDEHHVYMRMPDNWWVSGAANRPPVRPDDLAKRITGFEVLSESRAVTAKAVIDRLRDVTGAHKHPVYDQIAGEFGVQS